MNNIALQLFVTLVCVFVFPAVFAGDFLVGFVANVEIVKIKLLTGQVNVLLVDFVEVARPTAVDCDLRYCIAEYIMQIIRVLKLI